MVESKKVQVWSRVDEERRSNKAAMAAAAAAVKLCRLRGFVMVRVCLFTFSGTKRTPPLRAGRLTTVKPSNGHVKKATKCHTATPCTAHASYSPGRAAASAVLNKKYA